MLTDLVEQALSDDSYTADRGLRFLQEVDDHTLSTLGYAQLRHLARSAFSMEYRQFGQHLNRLARDL